ncbi:MAG: N-acetylmuramoyl-L-alanine amidase [Bacteroidetes bacterium]|nr:MAG: N-acetylmuramoyl-L-alanine amidase [Bacteroidota bacterium]
MLFLLGISILGTSQPLNLLKSSIKVVVIDAGHGGKDSGCHGEKGIQEKDIALDIALRLGKKIEAELPDVKVIYTRKDDRFVELWQRAAIANRNKADLFISVHCNAHTNKVLHGAETYVMGLHKSNGNLEVSRRENKSLKLEGNYEESGHYSDFDPNSAEAHIILSLYQNSFLNYSIDLASILQDKVRDKGEVLDLGVNQAGFVVLWKTTMPSILVETGYLTNIRDEAYLISEKGKNESASNIFEAVKEFKQKLEANK